MFFRIYNKAKHNSFYENKNLRLHVGKNLYRKLILLNAFILERYHPNQQCHFLLHTL